MPQAWLGEPNALEPPTDQELIVEALEGFDAGNPRPVRWGNGDPMYAQLTPQGYIIVNSGGDIFFEGPTPANHNPRTIIAGPKLPLWAPTRIPVA
jgi:hypothetical protein